MARLPTIVVAGLLAALTILSVAAASPGDLDPTFAGRGWLLTRQFFHYDQEYQPKGAQDMARQANGQAWETDCTEPGAPAQACRQPFFPDATS